MLFGKNFKVIKEFDSIFERIGKYEEFYAFNRDGELKYGILDRLFGQPSPANWHEGEYAKKMRSKAVEVLEKLIDDGNIEIIED